VKPETPDGPGAKRAPLDKYLRGELPATTLNTITQLKLASAAPLSLTLLHTRPRPRIGRTVYVLNPNRCDDLRYNLRLRGLTALPVMLF
jgi:hypothetical protein